MTHHYCCTKYSNKQLRADATQSKLKEWCDFHSCVLPCHCKYRTRTRCAYRLRVNIISSWDEGIDDTGGCVAAQLFAGVFALGITSTCSSSL